METADQLIERHEYQAEDVILVPYDEKAFADDFLVRMYYKIKLDGTADRVFASGVGWTLNQFIQVLRDKPLVVGLDKATYNAIGVGWLYEVSGQAGCMKATIGFFFVKEAWGTQKVRSLARLALQWWTEKLGVTVLYGTILSTNRIAQNFARKLGFKRVGTLPGFFVKDAQMVDAELVVLDTRERKPDERTERSG